MENVKQTPLTVGADDKQSLSIAGGTYRILVSGRETEGAFATIEMLVPPGGGPGPHSHANFQESFYVIDGVEVKSEVDNSEVSTYTASKGAFIVIPKGGVVHCFKNKTDKPALLLCVVVPSGLEEMFEEMGKPVAPGTVAEPPPMDAAAMEKVKAIAEKYGQKLYPPDYLD